ncbi:MAG: hypothetical protein ABI359_15510 [Ginsengibacter sp.]
MNIKILPAFMVLASIFISSCSRKTIPTKTATIITSEKNVSHPEVKANPAPAPETKKADTVAIASAPAEKPVEKEKVKSDFPNVISVNDNAASKSVDGRLFYDVIGHRYWKNYKDGKYYLFDKSMYNNPDFQPGK